MEHFFCPLVEVKFDQRGDDEGTIFGYGSVFGNVDSYGDTVAKGRSEKQFQMRSPVRVRGPQCSCNMVGSIRPPSAYGPALTKTTVV